MFSDDRANSPRQDSVARGPRGLAEDWMNELTRLLPAVQLDLGGIEAVRSQVIARPCQKYHERFPSENSLACVDIASVRELDEIVEQINSTSTTGTLTLSEFQTLYRRAELLVQGKHIAEWE